MMYLSDHDQEEATQEVCEHDHVEWLEAEDLEVCTDCGEVISEGQLSQIFPESL